MRYLSGTIQTDRIFVAILVVGLACLAVASQDWLFSSLSHMDSGKFVGLFAFYDRPDFRVDDYKTARVVYLIYNHLIYGVLGLPAPHVVAVLIPFLLCTVLAFLTLRTVVAAMPAFIASALLSLSPPFHDLTAGGLYNNTFSGVWYCLALLLVVGRPFRHAAFAAGACYAVAICSNLYMILLLAPFGLLFLLRRQDDRLFRPVAWLPTLRDCSLFLAGGLAALAAIGLTNKLVFGRPLWFLRPQIAFIRTYAGTSEQAQWGYNPYRSFWPGNDPTGWIYVFLFAVCILALVFARRFLLHGDRGAALIWNGLLCTGLFVVLNLSGTMTMFPVHLGHALFLPGYLALGVMIAPLTRSRSAPSFAGAVLLYAGMMAPLLLADLIGAGLLLGLALGCAVTVVLARQSIRIAALAIGLSSAAVLATPQPYWARYNPAAACHGDRDAYLAAERVVALTRLVESDPRKVRVWFDPAEAFACEGHRLSTPIYLSDHDFGATTRWSTDPGVPVAAIYDGIAPSWGMPAIDAITERDIGWTREPFADPVLLIITRNPDDGARFVAKLAEMQTPARIEQQPEIVQGSVSYRAIWLRIGSN